MGHCTGSRIQDKWGGGSGPSRAKTGASVVGGEGRGTAQACSRTFKVIRRDTPPRGPRGCRGVRDFAGEDRWRRRDRENGRPDDGRGGIWREGLYGVPVEPPPRADPHRADAFMIEREEELRDAAL